MYKQFLALCISSKNQQGETLAYNCLGIDFFKLKNYDESIQYHNKHLELADHTGRLVAHTNLGIVFQATIMGGLNLLLRPPAPSSFHLLCPPSFSSVRLRLPPPAVLLPSPPSASPFILPSP